jgi:glycosyltransferase involved in cell wall biosynthesis
LPAPQVKVDENLHTVLIRQRNDPTICDPSVSVVIPTYDRPMLVTRAVSSALAQTFDDIEVIVVIDGPNTEATRLALSAIADSRLRVTEHKTNRGSNATRNTGIAQARGKWIALLDDDDEWFPGKIEAQLQVAESSAQQYPIVTCQVVYRTPDADFILPRRLPCPGEHISDYLYSRQGLPHTETLLQTSLLFAPRNLFLRVPFDENLRANEDLDWLLRVFRLDGVGLEIVQETLSVWNADDDRPRISDHLIHWRDTYDWVLERRNLFSPRAYAAFIMSVVSGSASSTQEPKIFWLLLKEAYHNGRPALIDCLIFFYIWFIPQPIRHRMRHFLLGNPATVKLWGGPLRAMKKEPSRGAPYAYADQHLGSRG